MHLKSFYVTLLPKIQKENYYMVNGLLLYRAFLVCRPLKVLYTTCQHSFIHWWQRLDMLVPTCSSGAMQTGGTSGRTTNLLIGGCPAPEPQLLQKAKKSTAVRCKETLSQCLSHSNVSGSFTLENNLPLLRHQELSAALQAICSVMTWPVLTRFLLPRPLWKYIN